MKVLVHIHTYNDEDVIEKSLQSVLNQTYPADILVVDNGSTDSTLKRICSDRVTVIAQSGNLGTSGSVATGFRYAAEHEYDWIWILDADSIVFKDALEKLISLFHSLPSTDQQNIGALLSRIIRGETQPPDDYGRLTPNGPRPAWIDQNLPFYECDAGIWSGSLFRMDVVKEVGQPRYGVPGGWDDLSLDWGDVEYFMRIRQAGHKVLVRKDSLIRHALGWQKHGRFGGIQLHSTNHSAFRRYLYFRNAAYFWLYLYPGRNLFAVNAYLLRHMLAQIIKILLLEQNRAQKAFACIGGLSAGFLKRIHSHFYM